MRFFIALEVPEKNKKELERVQKQLKALIPQVRLTENEKLHLTIAFIGEKSEEFKQPLEEMLTKVVEGIKPFSVTPAYIDGFQTLHNPHTFWVGVKGDIDKLLILRERVKDGLIGLKSDVDERRFIPHIAIATTSDFILTTPQERELEKMMAVNFSPIEVISIKLFESIPDEGFHTHNTLAEIFLR